MARDLAWTLVWIAAFWPVIVGGPWIWDRYRKKNDARSRFWFCFYLGYSIAVLAAIILHYNVLNPTVRIAMARRFPFSPLERWLIVGLFFSVTAIFRARMHPGTFARLMSSRRYPS